MGCFTCNCLKNEGINLTNDVFDVYLVNPLLKRFIIKLQSNWRRFKFRNDFIKARSINFNLEILRPELKEIEPESFAPYISEAVTLQLKLLGSLVIDPQVIDSFERKNLIKKNPILFQNNQIYVGTWNLRGKREGFGEMYWPEGSKFEGLFKDDMMNGQGRLMNCEGDYYVGNFEDDKANGYGIYVSTENIIFRGFWKDDKQEGQGEEIYSDNCLYQGNFLNGTKHGKGRFVWSDGSCYEGDFIENSLQGIGTFTWKDGRVYTGQWKNNKMEGKGEFIWPDSKKYVGQYKSDKKWGYGIFIWPNGKRYEGGWFNGKQHGHGILTIKDRKKFGEWKMGKRLRWINENEQNYSNIINQIKNNVVGDEDLLNKNDFTSSYNKSNLNSINLDN